MTDIEKFKRKCRNLEAAYYEQEEVKRKIDAFLEWSEEICEDFKRSYDFVVFDTLLMTTLKIASTRRKHQSYILDH